jgi:hypothetical protein
MMTDFHGYELAAARMRHEELVRSAAKVSFERVPTTGGRMSPFHIGKALIARLGAGWHFGASFFEPAMVLRRRHP